jgi:peptide-methionine (R)-S-oxide reductase
VLFKEATERPRSSPLNEEKRPGAFVCAACNLALFDADTKYESGTGWPSFYQAIEGRVETKRDWKLILPRTEATCAEPSSAGPGRPAVGETPPSEASN